MNDTIRIKKARIQNLKNVTVDIPLGVMVGVAGVSGSGKSSLIADTLVPKFKLALKNRCITGDTDAQEKSSMDELFKANAGIGDSNLASTIVNTILTGTESLKRCYVIDQRPIGRSRTSCPATYTGIFDRVRKLFAETEQARAMSFDVGSFSVNSKGGCRKCKGTVWFIITSAMVISLMLTVKTAAVQAMCRK